MTMDFGAGHYEIGLRDGGSSWHIGTRNRRECNHDSCRSEAKAARAALVLASAAVAAERARITEAVGAMFGQVHPMAAMEDEPTRHDVVSRKAVLAIVETP